MISIMTKLQIQLPDSLYNNLRHLAERLDYSMAELLRRGAEQVIQCYPQHIDAGDPIKSSSSKRRSWIYPKAKKMGLKISDPVARRELANSSD